MVGKDPGVRDDSMLPKSSPFFPLVAKVHKLHSCVVLQVVFFFLFLPFSAYIWKFLDEPLFIDPAAPSSFLQPSIKSGLTHSEGLPQGFLLVEIKLSQLRLLDLRPHLVFHILFSAEQLYLPETFFSHLFSSGLWSGEEKEGS